MDRTQAAACLRKAVAYCPAMCVDHLTGDAWAEALAPYDYQDGLDAVAAVAATPVQPGGQLWVTVQAVIWQVRRWRSARIAAREHLLDAPPADPAAYIAWRRRAAELLGARDLDETALHALSGPSPQPAVDHRAGVQALTAHAARPVDGQAPLI